MKAKNFLLFRLAENINAILVHQTVRDHVISKGIPKEIFIRPEEWAQI